MEITDLPSQPVVAIKVSAPREKMADEIRRIYTALAAYMQAQGVEAAGPPYASFQFVGDQMTLDAGFPVAEALPGEGEIVAGELPGGKHAVSLHVGPFDQVGETYEALFRWIAEQGLRPAGGPREVYLTDPQSTTPDQLRTEVVCLVR